jgi:hypothetical protein
MVENGFKELEVSEGVLMFEETIRLGIEQKGAALDSFIIVLTDATIVFIIGVVIFVIARSVPVFQEKKFIRRKPLRFQPFYSLSLQYSF